MLGHEQFGSQGFQASRLVGPTTAMLKKAEHQTVSSKAKTSTPFGMFLAVKTVQARDKLAHRSHQARRKHDALEAPFWCQKRRRIIIQSFWAILFRIFTMQVANILITKQPQ